MFEICSFCGDLDGIRRSVNTVTCQNCEAEFQQWRKERDSTFEVRYWWCKVKYTVVFTGTKDEVETFLDEQERLGKCVWFEVQPCERMVF